ncbi:MAG TPA: TetR family transcriptional regulator [Actinoplanes sp.]|nr:TetR family transcriptional regulator [Actinoplanes sp.]
MSSEDLTARARIRDAAIDLFAERGIGPATVRDIAQRAGVSSGLLRHHFGSKEGLRDACDEHALARLAIVRQQMLRDGGLGDDTFMAAIRPEAVRLQSYLIRSMMDGSTGGEAMFQRMVEAGEDWLAGTDLQTADPRAYSAVLVAMQMGMFLMNDQIARAIGVEAGQPYPLGHTRILRAAVEIFAQPLLTSEQADQVIKALDRFTCPEEKP